MAHLSITVFYNELKRTLPFIPHHHPQVALEDLHEAAQRILAGQIRGRVVVNLAPPNASTGRGHSQIRTGSGIQRRIQSRGAKRNVAEGFGEKKAKRSVENC